MRRREFITLIGGAVASRPLPAFAQGSSTRPLMVISVGGSRAGTDRYFGGFLQGMRELGYIEGRDYGFEVRYADGQYDHIPAQMHELVHPYQTREFAVTVDTRNLSKRDTQYSSALRQIC